MRHPLRASGHNTGKKEVYLTLDDKPGEEDIAIREALDTIVD